MLVVSVPRRIGSVPVDEGEGARIFHSHSVGLRERLLPRTLWQVLSLRPPVPPSGVRCPFDRNQKELDEPMA